MTGSGNPEKFQKKIFISPSYPTFYFYHLCHGQGFKNCRNPFDSTLFTVFLPEKAMSHAASSVMPTGIRSVKKGNSREASTASD
jgi:hypothetical protein